MTVTIMLEVENKQVAFIRKRLKELGRDPDEAHVIACHLSPVGLAMRFSALSRDVACRSREKEKKATGKRRLIIER